MTTIPDHPDALLTRSETAEALTARGYPTKEKTLATKATRGGGPCYRLFGRKPLYRWGDALAWAEARLSPPRHTTSELQTQAATTSHQSNFADFAGAADKTSGSGQ